MIYLDLPPPNFFNVFANAQRRLFVVSRFGEAQNCWIDFPAAAAARVRAPGFLTAPAIQFFFAMITAEA
jgi:hypothetical protein